MRVFLTTILCLFFAADAFAQIRFSDATATSGIASGINAYGVSVIDYDLDGDDDLMIAASTDESKLYSNAGDATFTDVTTQAGLNITGNFATAIWADINNDGYPDLYAGNRRSGSSRLYLNRGGTFEDISDMSGLDLELEVGSAAWGDFNNDGKVDLFIATRDSTDALYLQTGEGEEVVFSDVATSLGVLGDSWSVAMQATWIDYDGDADLDLFCVHDGLYRNRMYANENAVFTNVAEEINIASAGAGSGMGVSWADVDGDGWEDVYISRIGRAGFFRNKGDGTFEDIAEASGAEPNGMSWGSVFEDFDLDGDRDLFVGSTFTFDNTPPILYENDGTGTFTNVAIAAGLTFMPDTFGAASGDFNGDGLPDIFMTDGRGNSRLLLNTTKTNGGWLRINLEGDRSNRMAIGATVDVHIGDSKIRRTLFAGDSYCSQSTPQMQFGLAEGAVVDSVTVAWPSGRTSVITEPVTNNVLAISEQATSVSVEEDSPLLFASTLEVSPNPASTTLRVETFLDTGHSIEVQIVDAIGRTVWQDQREVQQGAFSNEIDISTLAPGVYFVVLQDEGGRHAAKPVHVIR